MRWSLSTSNFYALIGQNLTGGLDCKTVRIFAYSSAREESNKRSGTGLKTESETLTPRFTDFFTDFEKKTDCFAVYTLVHAEIYAASGHLFTHS